MRGGQSLPSSSSIYSQLCWNCIRKQRSNGCQPASLQQTLRATRRTSTNGNGRRSGCVIQERGYHKQSRLRQQAASVTAEPHFDIPPSIPKLPIRERLAKWQEDHGSPISDLLAVNSGGIKVPSPDNYAPRSEADGGDMLDDFGEIPQSGSLQSGDDITSTRGVYYSMGDLVELDTHDQNGSPALAVFVRNISRNQSQVMTMRGKWMHVSRLAFRYTISGFIDPATVMPVTAYLPTEDIEAELLNQAMVMDVSVPRTVSGPIISALQKFALDADNVYRSNSTRLDNAHQILSHATDLRFGSLEKIATTLIRKGRLPEHALYAVRRALLRAGIGFGTDRRSHRTTGMFQIRSLEQLRLIETVQQWLRDYQEAQVAKQSLKDHENTGVKIVHNFLDKARALVMKSRETRTPHKSGFIGPTKVTHSLDDRAYMYRSGGEFTLEERQIIRFIEYWCLQSLFIYDDTLLSLAQSILRNTGCYHEFGFETHCGMMFLSEMGVIDPWTNRTLYDVNLLLPSSQHSKPLEKLASSLSQMNQADADLSDTMADLRHDFKDLNVFCIDSEDAKEIDDGISVERIRGSDSEYWAHIHIANPTAFIKRDSVFAKMAAHLTETFYAPELVYPMLPKWMSEQVFSLAPNRPTLTFSAKLNLKAEILDFKIQPGYVRNVVKLSYNQLPDLLGIKTDVPTPPSLVVGGSIPATPNERSVPPTLEPDVLADLQLLHVLSTALYEKRRMGGGIYYQPPQADVSVYSRTGYFGLQPSYSRRKFTSFVDGDPVIQLHSAPYQNFFDPSGSGPTDHLVREMMILACEVAGRFGAARNIPLIYRGLARNPELDVSADEYERDVVQPILQKYGFIPLQIGLDLVLRYGTSIIGTKPLDHRLMGVKHYSKITSPLRRYGDMITHWQIESALREESRSSPDKGEKIAHQKLAFSKPQIQSIIRSLQPRERLIARAKAACVHHWVAQFHFRAYTFNQLDLPRRFNVVVDTHERIGAAGHYRLTYGRTMDHGVRVSFSMEPGFERSYDDIRMGDVWECEIHDVNPHLTMIDVLPIRLLKREMEDVDFEQLRAQFSRRI